MRIYLVTDEGLLLGKDLYRTVEAAVKGGVSMVQLREKESSTREFIERAIRLKKVLTSYGVPVPPLPRALRHRRRRGARPANRRGRRTRGTKRYALRDG